MYDNGTDFTVNGIEYHGVTCLGSGWWIAFRKDDPRMDLTLVQEEQAA
jgi:hypothetical protein